MIILGLAGLISTSSMAYTSLQPVQLSNGYSVSSQLNSNNADMAYQQGCQYEEVYVPLWQKWSTQVGSQLNNTNGPNATNNFTNLAQKADTAGCMSGVLGQVAGLGSALNGLIGVLSGDISSAKALAYGQQLVSNQACSIANTYANQALNASGISNVTNGVNNVMNSPLGNLTRSVSQQTPPPPSDNPLNLLK